MMVEKSTTNSRFYISKILKVENRRTACDTLRQINVDCLQSAARPSQSPKVAKILVAWANMAMDAYLARRFVESE